MFQILATPLGDDNTPYIVGNNIDQVTLSLENHAGSLFKWFLDNEMKTNPYQCHELINERCGKEINYWQHYTEATTGGVLERKLSLDISENSQENTCGRVSYEFAGRSATLLKKETLAQLFSCEFCEISKNTFLTEHLRRLLLIIENSQCEKQLAKKINSKL